MPNDLGNVVLTTLDELVQRALNSRPVRTDGKPLNDVVYSHLRQGTMVDPRDFTKPWSPIGGASLQDAPLVPPPAPGTPAPPPAPPSDVNLKKALWAAWRTAELANATLMVTNDGSYEPYRSGRHLDFQYTAILEAMQAAPPPPIDPAVQQRVDDARKVLYDLDADGAIVGKSKLYQTYLTNAKAHAKAKREFAEGQAEAMADPNGKGAIWPQIAVELQQARDEAFDTWKTEGAEKVEAAINTIEAMGGSLGEKMIARARKNLDAWSLGLAGVPVQTPYSYIDPTGWCEIDDDEIGWEQLQITSSQASSHVASQANSFASGFYNSHSDSTDGGGTVGYGPFFVGGNASGSSTNSNSGSSSSSDGSMQFHNDGSDFTVDLEWGLCTINRPWLQSDLFYMGDWYLPGKKKGCISDGTIANQVLNEEPLLPMIPQQFLVVRNVRISSSNWGSDGATFRQLSDQSNGHYDADSSSYGGSAGVSLGFFSIGGSVSHSESNENGSWSGSSHESTNDDWSWHFDDQTLSIHGAQIVGWISEILPPCPPLDDPALSAPAAATTDTTPAPAGAPA
jgi:hypothetical protein